MGLVHSIYMMEQESVREIIQATHWPRIAGATALGVLALFLLVATASELRSYGYIGSGISPTNTITVSGEGKVFAVPDTAEFTYTVQDTEKDVQSAQDAVSKAGNDILAYLKTQGIADADVQTTDYSVNPQYSYQQAVCPSTPVVNGVNSSSAYCPPGKQTLTGYQASETVSVKVRDTSKAGGLLSAVGSKGATQVSGLSFIVADEKALEAQARGKAIDDARAQAQVLASQLGVTLVRVVGYNEGGGPIYYAKASGVMSMDAASAPAPIAPDIATGQSTITSDVNVTYEIR